MAFGEGMMPLNYSSRKSRKKRMKKCKICGTEFELHEEDSQNRNCCYRPSCLKKFRELKGKGELPHSKGYKSSANRAGGDFSKGIVWVLDMQTMKWEKKER